MSFKADYLNMRRGVPPFVVIRNPEVPPLKPTWILGCENAPVDFLSPVSLVYFSESEAVDAAVTIMRYMPDLRIVVIPPAEWGEPFVPLAHIELIVTSGVTADG
jgi:hypothetical protein